MLRVSNSHLREEVAGSGREECWAATENCIVLPRALILVCG